MEANEAPEKLYVNFHFIETHPGNHQPLATKQGINKYDIEYIRKDVVVDMLKTDGETMREKMIEKAVEWVEKNADNYTWYDEECADSGLTDDFIKDLRKAMSKN